ncbi:unnamed protein product, partial [marine sediment metagenome]
MDRQYYIYIMTNKRNSGICMKNYKGLLRFARNDNPMSLRG